MNPSLAMCNFISDPQELKAFALVHGFSGIDWSFDLECLPSTAKEEMDWIQAISRLAPLEVRYHCPFYKLDLGADNPIEAKKAEAVFQKIIRLVSKVGGKFLSIHIGLGRNSTEPLSWDRTVDNLRRLARYASQRGVILCLENLGWGWTSKPHLFEKLVRGGGVGVTFDVGHAYICESVQSHYYAIEDFVTPHADRVYNAHVYHTEIAGLGHIPPNHLDEVVDRLALLGEIGCLWWVLEVREQDGLLRTKTIVDDYLTRNKDSEPSESHETMKGLGAVD